MTKEMTITSPSGRRFRIERTGISYSYTVIEPNGAVIPHTLLGHDECRELVAYELSVEQRNLAHAW